MKDNQFIKDYKMQLAVCPVCGKALDGCFDISDRRTRPPFPGDVALCNGCASFNIFTDTYFLRAPTPYELKQIVSNPHNQKLHAWVTKYIQENKKA